MTWLEHLKSLETPDDDTTKPTKPPKEPISGGFVGFVAQSTARFEKFSAAHLPDDGAGEMSSICLPGEPLRRGLAIANTADSDADASCWPHSSAMNRAELSTFGSRVLLFREKGVPAADAERLAVQLVARNRECDDRTICLECVHVQGVGRWRCSRHHHEQWSLNNAERLQRCHSFEPTKT